MGIDEIDCDSGIISEFNGSNMSEEEKLEEIKKRVEAVIAAYRLAEQAYEIHRKGESNEYLEFRKKNLREVWDQEGEDGLILSAELCSNNALWMIKLILLEKQVLSSVAHIFRDE